MPTVPPPPPLPRPRTNLGAPHLASEMWEKNPIHKKILPVALDKDEGFVKAQITRAVREHRLISQRV